MQKDVQLTVVGKVFRPNKQKVLALNRCLSGYFRLVRWYLGFNSSSKKFLHESCYERAKELFNLNTALIQTARDKAVEILKSFEENEKEGGTLRLRRISVRFDRRCCSFSRTTDVLTPYWLTLSLSRRERISLPIVFGERQRERIEEAFGGEGNFAAVEMVKRNGVWYAHFILSKTVEPIDGPETVIAIEGGEAGLDVAAAVSKENPEKPMKGQFWRGEEIKRTRGLYNHIRRKLQGKGRIYKCPNCGMEYDRGLNACINIAHRVMSSMGWGSCEPPEPADVAESVKLQANAGSPTREGGVVHTMMDVLRLKR